jgi:hypothetical protein
MRALIASIILAIVLITVSAGQDRKTFTVGSATAPRGQKVTGNKTL